ncbi:MAG: hypothetical protein L6V95_00315 [Candidatus Melainabacteria bacterium]|nr:MAG: hypothetical protein L6V95_00315 [Candidatus Melainabacteria bacterium]
MKGIYPNEYLKNPKINKPIKKIWDDIDAYTGEFFEDEPQYHWTIDFIIPIPPLYIMKVNLQKVYYLHKLLHIS